MAIYNLDAVNEALAQQSEEIVEEEASILDSLEEACDYMMESICLINEGARRKYVGMLLDKSEKLGKEIEKNKRLAQTTTSDSAKRAYEEKNRALQSKKDSADVRAKEISGNYPGLIGNEKNYENAKRAYEADKHKPKYDYKSPYISDSHKDNSEAMNHRRTAAGIFKQWYHDDGKDKLAERKPGQFKTSEGLSAKYDAKDQKKKAIKETCLHILSIIDDIDN